LSGVQAAAYQSTSAKLGQRVAEGRKKLLLSGRLIREQKLSSINERLLIIRSRMVILLQRRLLRRISEDTNIVCHKCPVPYSLAMFYACGLINLALSIFR